MKQSRIIGTKKGRPRTGIGTPVQTRLSGDQLAQLDAWIAKQPVEMSRPEALRQLMTLGLADKMLNGKVAKRRK
jgi:cytochrome c553